MADEDLCRVCKSSNPPNIPDSIQINWVSCDDCKGWFHLTCIGHDETWLAGLGNDTPYFCFPCLAAREDSEDDDTPAQPLQELSQNSRNDDTQNIAPGHSIVQRILAHDFTNNKKERQFQVEYEDGIKLWHYERDLTACIAKVDAYCMKNKLTKSKYKPSSRMGATLEVRQNDRNWLHMEDTLRLVKAFGKPGDLETSEFTTLGKEDSIYIHQIGEHAYTILWLAKQRTCFIADGMNTFIEDEDVKRDLIPLLIGARVIRAVKFNGQKFADHCASSAAALAIEFARLYKSGPQAIQTSIRVPDSILGRLQKIAHKEESDRIQKWRPINQLDFKLSCPRCGCKVKGKNRAALNFHKCQAPTSSDQ